MYTSDYRQNKALREQEAFIRRMIAQQQRKAVREAVRAYYNVLFTTKEAVRYE